MTEKKLTRSQLLIMKTIWDAGQDISYQELLDVLDRNSEHGYKRSTLVTFLTQLEAMGYITTYRVGRYAYIKPEVSEEQFRQWHAVEETNQWYQGKAAVFLTALHAAGKLTQKDKEEIRRLIDDLDDTLDD